MFLHVFKYKHIPQTHIWNKGFSPFCLLLSLPSLCSYSYSSFPPLFSSPSLSSLRQSCQSWPPCPSPTEHPGWFHHTRRRVFFPQSCSHPVTLCLISSAVMWNCVCVCVRQISLLRPHWGSVEIAIGCTMMAFTDVQTHTHTQTQLGPLVGQLYINLPQWLTERCQVCLGLLTFTLNICFFQTLSSIGGVKKMSLSKFSGQK